MQERDVMFNQTASTDKKTVTRKVDDNAFTEISLFSDSGTSADANNEHFANNINNNDSISNDENRSNTIEDNLDHRTAAFNAAKAGNSALVGALLAVETPEEGEKRKALLKEIDKLHEEEQEAEFKTTLLNRQAELLEGYLLAPQSTSETEKTLAKKLDTVRNNTINLIVQTQTDRLQTSQKNDDVEAFQEKLCDRSTRIAQQQSITSDQLKNPKVLVEDLKLKAKDEAQAILFISNKKSLRNHEIGILEGQQQQRREKKTAAIQTLCDNPTLLPEPYQKLNGERLVSTLQKTNVLMTERNSKGDTLLHVSAKEFKKADKDSTTKIKHAKVADLLIECGADLDAVNLRYQTPAECAGVNDKKVLVATMRKAANPSPSLFYKEVENHVKHYEKEVLEKTKSSFILRNLHNKKRLNDREKEVNTYHETLSKNQALLDDEELANTVEKVGRQAERGFWNRTELHEPLLKAAAKYRQEPNYGRRLTDLVQGIAESALVEKEKEHRQQLAAKDKIIQQKDQEIVLGKIALEKKTNLVEAIEAEKEQFKQSCNKLVKINMNLRRDNADLKVHLSKLESLLERFLPPNEQDRSSRQEQYAKENEYHSPNDENNERANEHQASDDDNQEDNKADHSSPLQGYVIQQTPLSSGSRYQQNQFGSSSSTPKSNAIPLGSINSNDNTPPLWAKRQPASDYQEKRNGRHKKPSFSPQLDEYSENRAANNPNPTK